MRRIIPLIALWLLTLAGQAEDLTRFVNPFIGTAATGHTFPGACRPFGLVQASPWTGSVGWQYCTGYVHGDPTIWGFAQTCLNGTGCADLGDILVQPTLIDGDVLQRLTRKAAPDSEPKTGACPATYDAQSEKAAPGYYTVTYTSGIKTEATATEHVGCYRFTFPAAGGQEPVEGHTPFGLYVDLQHAPAWQPTSYFEQIKASEVCREDAQTLSGHTRSVIWTDQDVYFVLRFSKPMAKMHDRPLRAEEKGRKLLFEFDLAGAGQGEPLEVYVALSSRSVEGAKHNLKAEAQGGFDAIRRQATQDWQRMLERFTIDGTDDQKTNFYTSVYHALIQPNNLADAGEAPEYSTFSCWDTYRALHPFYTLAFPDRVDGLVNSLITQGERLGHLPIWGLWGNDNYCMIGNHAVSIVAEAYMKGFRGFDAERAWRAVDRSLSVSHEPKSDWELRNRYHYFPTDLTESESVSRTLECAYDDYAAFRMAQALGKKADAARYAEQATWWKNLFDTSTGFARPRLSDGTWKSPFQPSAVGHSESIGGDYTEGNAWQYTFHVQHDVPGLIRLLGGKQAFCQKLDSFFTLRLTTTLSDVTGLIGQYAHGNEPSHHVAYLYTLAGQPRRTQELVRQICTTLYQPRPDGLSGNDDCGQMSAWYMLSSMGFYPVDPVSAEYVLGAPQMPRIALQLGGGRTLVVVAKNLSEQNKYVRRVLWNGKPWKRTTIPHSLLAGGGTLTFEMTDK